MKEISKLQYSDILNEDTISGVFYTEDLNEMARFGKIPNTRYEIHMEPGEGNIPHMHICIKTGKKIVLRVCILKNEYFREKDDICNKLNTNERKALDNYLNLMYSAEFGITNWQDLCLRWNQLNPAHQIENIKSLQKPDFTEITEPQKTKGR